jgi:dihydrofolate reductase
VSETSAPVVASLQRPRIVLVVAVAENGVIGQGGRLPWRLKSEMRHFRDVTWGKPVVVGRKTYESFARKPLPGRTNIVVTRDRALTIPGALVTTSVSAALDAARGDALRRGVGDISVVGGADIYAQTIGDADRLVVTRVKLQPAGDTTFPPIDPKVWREVEHTDHAAGPEDEAGYSIYVYERLQPTEIARNH